MAGWRDDVLREFTPGVARLTIAADPDGLLLEAGVLEALRARGFQVTSFEDRIAFRFFYESRFRSPRDRGDPGDLVVVLRGEASNLEAIPCDVLQAGAPGLRARRGGVLLPAELDAVRRRRQPQSAVGALPARPRRGRRGAQGDGWMRPDERQD